ncbi:response regulator transcription factor [Paraburkholderia tropica]|uniref:response regulator transcription factor n=1 Tax=Paraburkholderia tropica TaxID=92647 RepID=UPI002AB0DB32|nr:response regulator [Paraburkholderia tropica]
MAYDNSPTVFIVDDDQSVRRSLHFLLQSVGYHIESFANGREFLDAVEHDAIGCLLLDVRMPQMGGFELQQELQDARFTLPIIFLTGNGDIPMTVRALKNGAFDFVEKPYNDQAIIDKVAAAIKLSSSTFASRHSREHADQMLSLLSKREREVVNLLVKGMSSKVIARELDISFKTVEVHRANIRQKLAINSVADLVRLVIEP